MTRLSARCVFFRYDVLLHAPEQLGRETPSGFCLLAQACATRRNIQGKA
jgi:hypothetical protein